MQLPMTKKKRECSFGDGIPPKSVPMLAIGFGPNLSLKTVSLPKVCQTPARPNGEDANEGS